MISNSVTLEKSTVRKLLDLLKQDIAEASPQELIGIPCGQMELYATSYADMDEHIAPESFSYLAPTIAAQTTNRSITTSTMNIKDHHQLKLFKRATNS